MGLRAFPGGAGLDGWEAADPPFLPYFGEEESKLDLALALLAWAEEEGFKPEGVLFDAWYAAKEVLMWFHDRGWPFVTRLRSNRVLDGVQLRRHAGTRWVKTGRLRGLQQELGWVVYGLTGQREGLGLSFYQCRRKLISGRLRLDLSPLLSGNAGAA